MAALAWPDSGALAVIKISAHVSSNRNDMSLPAALRIAAIGYFTPLRIGGRGQIDTLGDVNRSFHASEQRVLARCRGFARTGALNSFPTPKHELPGRHIYLFTSKARLDPRPRHDVI